MYQDSVAGRARLRGRAQRGALRGGPGPGAGRQAPRGPRAGPRHRGHRVPLAEGPSPLRPGTRPRLPRRPGRGPAAQRGQSQLLPGRSREGDGGGYRRHPLHLGHHRPAQGGRPDERQRPPPGVGGGRVRGPRFGRGHPCLPADGLGRRQHLLLRAVLPHRLLRQLPGERGHGDDRPRGDRPDLLLRAAPRLREPADERHDPDGGREPAQAADVPPLHGRCGPRRETAPRRRGGALRRPLPLLAREPLRLRPASQHPRLLSGASRLHRGRGDRPGHLRLLPVDRDQHQAALRSDGGFRLRHHPARRRGGPGDGGAAPLERRAQAHRRGRGALPQPRGVPRVLQEPGGDGRHQDRGRVGAHRRRRDPRRERTPSHHRPGEGRREAPGRLPLRSQVPREQAQGSSPTSRRRCASGTAATG